MFELGLNQEVKSRHLEMEGKDIPSSENWINSDVLLQTHPIFNYSSLTYFALAMPVFLVFFKQGRFFKQAFPPQGLCVCCSLPRMISLQISARMAFLTPASLCYNVIFSEKTYLTLPITLPWFFHSTYYYVKCYTFYLLALCILLPKEQKLSSDFKNCLHMVGMKWLCMDKLTDGINEWKRFLPSNRIWSSGGDR